MKREEAIKIIKGLVGTLEFSASQEDALIVAIEALQREEAEANGYCHRIKPKGGDTE